MNDGLQLCELTSRDAPSGLRLSRLANWNQTLQDWKFLLTKGVGFGFQTKDRLLISSMIALPLGPRHGWISMVLTDPEWRRRGLAKQLMGKGIDILEQRGLIPTLDATPDGETVYRAIGFCGDTGLARWKVSPDPSLTPSIVEHSLRLRRVAQSDLDRLADWDRRQSGCDRAAILRFLWNNRPDLAHVALDADGDIRGYTMGRSGDRLPQIGPLVAVDSSSAHHLLKTALLQVDGPVYVDAFDQNQPALAQTTGGAWSRERGFTRLLKSSSASPETASSAYLAAGPELS